MGSICTGLMTMNKIDKAVHDLKGVLPDLVHPPEYGANIDVGCYFLAPPYIYFMGIAGGRAICTKSEFEKRARELGYINGYRWGVEYLTNGKKPDLMEDVLIDAKCEKGTNEWLGWTDMEVSDAAWTDTDNQFPVSSFKIIDPRYKPKDTSYLDKPTVVGVDMASGKGETIECIVRTKIELEVVNSEDWYDYENQKALRLPPVGEKVDGFIGLVFSPFKCTFVGIDSEGRIVVEKLDGNLYRYMTNQINLRPLDWNRKAEAERKRVVDAAQKVCVNFSSNDLGKLYDAGYLRIPPEKN